MLLSATGEATCGSERSGATSDALRPQRHRAMEPLRSAKSDLGQVQPRIEVRQTFDRCLQLPRLRAWDQPTGTMALSATNKPEHLQQRAFTENVGLLEHLVGEGEQVRRDSETQRHRGSRVDHELKLVRSFDGEIARLFPFQDLVGE